MACFNLPALTRLFTEPVHQAFGKFNGELKAEHAARHKANKEAEKPLPKPVVDLGAFGAALGAGKPPQAQAAEEEAELIFEIDGLGPMEDCDSAGTGAKKAKTAGKTKKPKAKRSASKFDTESGGAVSVSKKTKKTKFKSKK